MSTLYIIVSYILLQNKKKSTLSSSSVTDCYRDNIKVIHTALCFPGCRPIPEYTSWNYTHWHLSLAKIYCTNKTTLTENWTPSLTQNSDYPSCNTFWGAFSSCRWILCILCHWLHPCSKARQSRLTKSPTSEAEPVIWGKKPEWSSKTHAPSSRPGWLAQGYKGKVAAAEQRWIGRLR